MWMNTNNLTAYGQKSVRETAHNIENGVERVKAFKNKVAKKKEKELIEKSAKNTSIKSIKTTQNVAKQTERTVKAWEKVAQQTAKRIKATTEASIKAVVNAIKITI